jgi:hypothetical protein
MSIKQFRRQAATCCEIASMMSDPCDRDRLLKTAHTFRQLADDEEGAGGKPCAERETYDDDPIPISTLPNRQIIAPQSA